MRPNVQNKTTPRLPGRSASCVDPFVKLHRLFTSVTIAVASAELARRCALRSEHSFHSGTESASGVQQTSGSKPSLALPNAELREMLCSNPWP